MDYIDREHQAAQYIIENLSARVEKEKKQLETKQKKQL